MSDKPPPRRRSSSTMAAVSPAASEPPLPTTFEELAREVRAIRRIVDVHVAAAIVERRNAETRHGALLDLIGDVIDRLPEPQTT